MTEKTDIKFPNLLGISNNKDQADKYEDFWIAKSNNISKIGYTSQFFFNALHNFFIILYFAIDFLFTYFFCKF